MFVTQDAATLLFVCRVLGVAAAVATMQIQQHPRKHGTQTPLCCFVSLQAWFETNESSDPQPWIEVLLPSNVTIVHFNKYTFAHGHRRSGYYRMRNWKTMTAEALDSTFTDTTTRYCAVCL